MSGEAIVQATLASVTPPALPDGVRALRYTNAKGEVLRDQCQRMADTLKGPNADLAQVYAAELATIRKRK